MTIMHELEEKGYVKVSKITKPSTYRTVHKSSFDAGSLNVRDNVGWAVAEIIAVDEKCSSHEEKHILGKWSVLVSGDPIQPSVQKLLITNDGETYKLYDSKGTAITTGPLESIIPYARISLCPKAGFDVSNEKTYQLITYGAPGTGKSHRTKLETEGHAVYRTTFHPDSDYSTFVGAYKPTMSNNAGCTEVYKKTEKGDILDSTQRMVKGIAYDFVPQAFIKAYVDAWRKMYEANASGGTPAPVYLVIEEINRGNCAQIFGDLFQLLDRNEAGYSEYAIDADEDLARWLGARLGGAVGDGTPSLPPDVMSGKKLMLPPNLYIRATMNTSDQSLFPIDSAFKRRWEWKYVPIAKPSEPGWKDRVIVADGKKYDWWDFLTKVNGQILETTKSEDKQLGYFFVKAPDATGHITADRFTGKVLFYLYNDVFKDYSLPATLFGDGFGGSTKYEFKMFFDEHGETIEKVVAGFLEQLKVPNGSLASADDGETPSLPAAVA